MHCTKEFSSYERHNKSQHISQARLYEKHYNSPTFIKTTDVFIKTTTAQVQVFMKTTTKPPQRRYRSL